MSKLPRLSGQECVAILLRMKVLLDTCVADRLVASALVAAGHD